MSSPGSVSRRIAELKTGDQVAAAELCRRYFDELVRLARQKLRRASRRVADEEDVAVDVLDSLCRGAEHGRFPLLANRDDLWRLLAKLTARKAVNQIEHLNAKKRGGGKVRGESAFDHSQEESGPPGIQGVSDKAPSPTLVKLREGLQQLLADLDDENSRRIVIWKWQGYTHQEIATLLGRSLSYVDRKWGLIRKPRRERR
jgi:DNA-directed RNA polymerase specialized sigma24 family protein